MRKTRINIFMLFRLFCAISLVFPVMLANAQTLVIDSVSVNPTNNHPIIGWTLQTSETEGYIEVNRLTPGGTFGLIHTTSSLNESFFEDNGVSGVGQTQKYYLAAFTQDGATIAASQAHSTIFLQQLVSDFCEISVNVFWMNYQVTTTSGTGIPQPVPFDLVRIQYSSDGTNFQNAATLPLPPISTEMQNRTVQLPGPGIYHFRIQAHSSTTGVTSTSNIRQVNFDPPQITNLYLNNIDVVDNQEIRVFWDAEGDTSDFRYVFFRSDNALNGFEPLDTVFQIQPYVDQDVEISAGPWFYKIESYLIENDCDVPSTSTAANFSSIFLTASVDLSNNRIDFDWQHNFPDDVSFDYVLQRLDNSGVWQEVTNVNFSGFNQGFFNLIQGDLAGTVVLRLQANRTDQPIVFVHSNHVNVSIEPQVFIPNAFRPSSAIFENTTFKPIIPGYEPAQFQLIVFDRWGLKIFESSTMEIGWDGTVNGIKAQPGAYSYLLRFSGLEGETIEKRGVVVLVL